MFIYKEPKLDEIVKSMRNVGKMLIPYNFPRAAPPILGDDLAFFKEREVIIDGYQVVLHYQKSDYSSHFMETLQVYNRNNPFLPFSLVCKIAQRFLGSESLSLVELFRDNRKIYCWTAFVDDAGKAIRSPYELETEECDFEGFKYAYMQPNQVNFY